MKANKIKWVKAYDSGKCRNYVYEDENNYVSIWYYSLKKFKYELSMRGSLEKKKFFTLKEAKEFAELNQMGKIGFGCCPLNEGEI